MHGCVVVRHGQGQEASQGTTEGVSISLRLPEGSGGCFSLMGSGRAEFYNDSPCHTHTHPSSSNIHRVLPCTHTVLPSHTHSPPSHAHTHILEKLLDCHSCLIFTTLLDFPGCKVRIMLFLGLSELIHGKYLDQFRRW